MERIALGSMKIYKDNRYDFFEIFNEDNGFLLRSNIIKNNKETRNEPAQRSYPELIDIGIMGHCDACDTGLCKLFGVDCYQHAGNRKRPNMALEDFENIITQSKGKTFQVALGGAGDPNKHEHFEQILKISRDNGIVPNLTTSGFALKDREIKAIKEYCGAVAVSYYSKLDEKGIETNRQTIEAIEKLIAAGCKTNIHYVISRQNIKEVIYRLQNNRFPQGINAVIFLLHKSIDGLSLDKSIDGQNKDYIEFINIATKEKFNFKIGFDSCQTPALKIFGANIAKESLEYCEAARFSMYIDCEMNAYPCSFGWTNTGYSVALKEKTILEAWNSKEFDRFREKQHCKNCGKKGCYVCALNLDKNICGRFC